MTNRPRRRLAWRTRIVTRNDRAKISDVWRKFDEACWEDATGPTNRVLTLTPESGEVWASPGKAVALVNMVVAAVNGAALRMGDNPRVKL